jgi:hypothetical protein
MVYPWYVTTVNIGPWGIHLFEYPRIGKSDPGASQWNRLLYLYNRRHAIRTCVSLWSEKQARLGYLLNWDAPKSNMSPFYPPSSQFRSSVIVFSYRRRSPWSTSSIRVSYLSFLRTVAFHYKGRQALSSASRIDPKARRAPYGRVSFHIASPSMV